MRLAVGLALGLLVGSAAAQFPAGKLPPNYKLVLENADVLVYRVNYGPHEKIAEHDHSDFATVYVYLNDSGLVKISHSGADASVVTRPPTHTGAFRVGTGRFERHAVENLSDLPSDFLRVELKIPECWDI